MAYNLATDDGNVLWSDNHSLHSDDGLPVDAPQQSSWVPSAQAASSPEHMSPVARVNHTGQLSPISTGMEMPTGPADQHGSLSRPSTSSAAPASAMSLTSADVSLDSWALDFTEEDDGDDAVDHQMYWVQSPEDVRDASPEGQRRPKIEEDEEEDFCMNDVSEAPITPLASSSATTPSKVKVKRPRGRPRKHPIAPITNANKVTKGRSKTGCITCRKRKKKCDETKPRCMNCEKNAVVCEGYPEKQIWRSGRERAEEDRRKSHHSLPSITLQPIFDGLESPEDMFFFKHYHERLSPVLTVEGEYRNAFRDLLVPIATKHQGLMHSILALSSKHLDQAAPYFEQYRKRFPTVTIESLQHRGLHHHDKARERFNEDINRYGNYSNYSKDGDSDPEHRNLGLSARYGQMLCMLAESLAEGNPRGEHRIHLRGYQKLIQESPPEDPAFLAFITEFFQYHSFADELIHLTEPQGSRPVISISSDAVTPTDPETFSLAHPPRLIGLDDRLYGYMCQITSLRDYIRYNYVAEIDPLVDYTCILAVADIDHSIRGWSTMWPVSDSRHRVSLLYKQMVWVYLFRTLHIYQPSSMSNSTSSSTTSVPYTCTPPRSAPTSVASSPSPEPDSFDSDVNMERHPLHRRHTIAMTGSRAGSVGNEPRRPHPNPIQQVMREIHLRADSPLPVPQPDEHEKKINTAVEEALTMLASFKPSDPAQTLLLMPCLVIGTACFAPAQRERVRAAVQTVRGYTGLRNTDRVEELLDEVWRLMDRREWMKVWDWQGVAKSLGIDFLCT